MARPPYKAEQRNQIFACFVNAAHEIMDAEGMEGLTLRRVSQRAGYNSATLYNYFKDLEHLTMYASMKYFQVYNQNLAAHIVGLEDSFARFLTNWEFFCVSAFQHPHAFYNLFYGKYSGEIDEIMRSYYQVFPEELGEMDAVALHMLSHGPLDERNRALLYPLVTEGYLSEEQAPIFNDIMLYCFKELLHQKMQRGDALENRALVDRQMSYIRALLRR